MEILRCVPITVMERLTPRTGPCPITQGDSMIDVPTHMTTFGGWKPPVNVMDVCPMLHGGLVEELDETPKA